MTQAALFEIEASAKPAWEKSGGVYGNCGATYTHSSGFVVQHCGHPTALRPYVIIAPDGTHSYAPNGLGFRLLCEAKRRAEELAEAVHE